MTHPAEAELVLTSGRGDPRGMADAKVLARSGAALPLFWLVLYDVDDLMLLKDWSEGSDPRVDPPELEFKVLQTSINAGLRKAEFRLPLLKKIFGKGIAAPFNMWRHFLQGQSRRIITANPHELYWLYENPQILRHQIRAGLEAFEGQGGAQVEDLLVLAGFKEGALPERIRCEKLSGQEAEIPFPPGLAGHRITTGKSSWLAALFGG